MYAGSTNVQGYLNLAIIDVTILLYQFTHYNINVYWSHNCFRTSFTIEIRKHKKLYLEYVTSSLEEMKTRSGFTSNLSK